MINWKEAPEAATHWDIAWHRFCNLSGFWNRNHDMYFPCVNLDIGIGKYIARPVEAVGIDWTEADGKNFALQNKKTGFVKFFEDKPVENDRRAYEVITNDDQYIVDWWEIIERPTKAEVEAPIYTQVMFDHKIKPKVGIRCLFKHGGYDTEGTVTVITKEYIVLTECTGKERIRKLSEPPIKPFDTRTDKEKAIEDLDLMITDAYNVVTDTYKSSNQFTVEAKALLIAIELGKIHGVKWVGK